MSNDYVDLAAYPLLDGSKFIDGTYAPAGGNMPVVGYSGDSLCGVVRTSDQYSYSQSIKVSTTADGRKILTPPDGSDSYQNGYWRYSSMYQKNMVTSRLFRVSFDLRLANLAGVTLSNVTRAVLGRDNLGGALSIKVNTATGATLGGVDLPARIMSGDWVHIDLYFNATASGQGVLVIDGNFEENLRSVYFTLPAYPPCFAFAVNALNSSNWPECPHVELGNPSIYILQYGYTPFIGSAALSVTESGTDSATLSAAVTYAPDTIERTVSAAEWRMYKDDGTYADSTEDTYTVSDSGDLLYVVTTQGQVPGYEYPNEIPNFPSAIHRVQPLEDFMQTSWSTGDSTRTITVTANGEYSVTVTNPGGSVTAAISITIPGLQTFDVFSGEPVPEGEWLPADRQSSAYRTGRATVQSQYSASPRILFLAEYYWSMLDPTESINLMLKKMIDPVTAEGSGLDAWGRIVGIKRALVPTVGEYLAFDPAGLDNELGNSFNNAPWNPLLASGMAPDAVYRIYVFVKAMLNIGNGSLADLNRYFSLLYEDSGITVLHVGTMVLRVMDFGGRLTSADMLALKSLDWVPLGVGWQLWQGEPDCFGFAGSGLKPFDQAPFIGDNVITQY